MIVIRGTRGDARHAENGGSIIDAVFIPSVQMIFMFTFQSNFFGPNSDTKKQKYGEAVRGWVPGGCLLNSEDLCSFGGGLCLLRVPL